MEKSKIDSTVVIKYDNKEDVFKAFTETGEDVTFMYDIRAEDGEDPNTKTIIIIDRVRPRIEFKYEGNI